MVTSDNQNHYCVVVSTAAQRSNDKAALLNSTRWNTGDEIRVSLHGGRPGPSEPSEGGRANSGPHRTWRT